MLTPFLAIATLVITGVTITAGYTQTSALQLREERQSLYWPRYGTTLSGRYYGNSWQPLPTRSAYGEFRGGGPGAGK